MSPIVNKAEGVGSYLRNNMKHPIKKFSSQWMLRKITDVYSENTRKL
jgi:hypothetical protein